jgi:cell division protein FtsQ
MIPNQGTNFPDVLIASGQIIERLKPGKQITQLMSKEVLRLSAFIAADSLWNAQFQQLYVDNYQELILIPRVGKHSIVVGNAEELPLKFENLRLFYDEGFKTVGWEKYRQLDISIRNQVIGRGPVQNTEQK